MEKQIQELTDKLFKEGVEKGQAQAEQIITEARSEANDIILNAKNEAEAIVANAKKQCEELHKNTISELKLYAGQTQEAVKSAITNCLTDTLSAEAAKTTVEDKAFLQKIILNLVATWGEKEELVIESADAEALKAYFAKQTKNLLDKGVSIEQVNGLQHAFTVAPADGSYKIVFGEKEFIELFRDFLRPALVEMLYK